MKQLNIHSNCVANSGKQPVPTYWLDTAVSFSNICGAMDLEPTEGVE